MTKISTLNIADIDSKIAIYKKFFASAKEVNEQIFHQNNLTSSQNIFLEILKEFDLFAKSNRNPCANEQTSSKISSYIENLDEIEKEIKIEQEKRLASNNSSEMSDIFHHGNSINQTLEPEGRVKISDFEKFLTKEESYSSKNHETNHQKDFHLKSNASNASNASILFSILNSVITKNDCPEFITKKSAKANAKADDLGQLESLELLELKGEFFEISIHDKLKHAKKIVRIGFVKEGEFAIFSQNSNAIFTKIDDVEISDQFFHAILKLIYSHSNSRKTIAGVNLYQITNGFYIDETGKIIAYNYDNKSLFAIAPIELSTYDLQIINHEIDLDLTYQLFTDPDYKNLTDSLNFGLLDDGGVIQIYQKNSSNDFVIAKNSQEIIDFTKKLQPKLKNILIFSAFSFALRGSWDLLGKVSIDHRITKQSIIDHIKSYLFSSFDDPFDINFLAKISANAPSLNYHIAKLITENHGHFLPQIIYGQLDPNPTSTSFAIRLFSRHPNFLTGNFKEVLGFITHSIIASDQLNRGFDFDELKLITKEDCILAYTNCLSQYLRDLESCQKEQIFNFTAPIYQSFVKLIEFSAKEPKLGANYYLIFPLISKILESFSHQPSLFTLIHQILFNALLDARINKNSKSFTAISLKICASLTQNSPSNHQDLFDRLISAANFNQNLANLIKITCNQVEKFSPLHRINALSVLDFHENNFDHHPNLTICQTLSIMPTYLSHDELQFFTRNARRELNLLDCDLTVTNRNAKIAKQIRTLENKYQHGKPDLVNFTQTFNDLDYLVTKSIIEDSFGNVLYKIGDSIYDFILAPIKYFFADDSQIFDFLLTQIESLNVAAQNHGIDPDSNQDLQTLKRLKPRLHSVIAKITKHIYDQDPSHPYLTFLKGFNSSSEGEMFIDVQSFLQDKFPNNFICTTTDETLTVKLLSNSVQYQSNCNIQIIDQNDSSLNPNPLASLQATGLINIDYKNNAKIINNSFIHDFKNHALDLKTSDEIQRFIALNANCHQFDEIFYDIITNPSIASSLSSLFMNHESDYNRISLDDNEEQIYIPRDKQCGFVFTVNRNPDRTINSVILHNGLYQYDAVNEYYHEILDHLTPANFNELSIRLSDVVKLCHLINKNTRPLRDAFCEMKEVKFDKSSQIGDVRSSHLYNFKFRSIGKLNSGKKLYLDENGRLLINSSLTKIKFEPITHPLLHLVEKLPAEEVSPDFNLKFSAQYFDYRTKPFHRYPSTFDVWVRKIGNYHDAKNNLISIYHDAQDRYFKSIPKSKNIQEILDLNNQDQSIEVQIMIDSFKERVLIEQINFEKIYQLLQKNNQSRKIAINSKPHNANKGYVFVKNGVKYVLFQDETSKNYHLMRLTYEKGVKKSKTAIINDPDQERLIAAQIERRAIFDVLIPGTYLLKGAKNLEIIEEKMHNISIKSFISDDQIIAIDSNLRILHKKPHEKHYHIATFSKGKELMPHFYDCISKALVRLDDWKCYYPHTRNS